MPNPGFSEIEEKYLNLIIQMQGGERDKYSIMLAVEDDLMSNGLIVAQLYLLPNLKTWRKDMKKLPYFEEGQEPEAEIFRKYFNSALIQFMVLMILRESVLKLATKPGLGMIYSYVIGIFMRCLMDSRER